MTTTLDVLAGRVNFAVECKDAIDFFNALPPLSLDLVCGSPPYSDARLYLENGEDKGIALGCEEWVEWMLRVTEAAHRACKGPVIWVVAGVTRDRNYWPGCEGLAWEWWRKGGDCQLYRPCIYRRVGIPGSGTTAADGIHQEWFRADWEYILCFKHSGALPWADAAVCGHPPRWAPGGAMSHRLTSGQRVNYAKDPYHLKGSKNGAGKDKEGRPQKKCGKGAAMDRKPPPPPADPGGEEDFWTGEPEEKEEKGKGPFGSIASSIGRKKDGTPEPVRKSSISRKPDTPRKPAGEGEEQGEEEYRTRRERAEAGEGRIIGVGGERKDEEQNYIPPVLANPGTVIDPPLYTAREVSELLGEASDILDVVVGGGRMGSKLASENEAPYVEAVPERFIRSFCPPGGVCADPFVGSGTSACVSLRWGRRFVGADIRPSQVALTRRRVEGETPLALFGQE